jgi:ArsR family transcriptional regulator
MSKPWKSPVAKDWPPAAEQTVSAETAAELAPILTALGDPVRLRLLSVVAATAEISTGEAATACGSAEADISRQLGVLHEVGLIDSERRGTRVHHRIRSAAMAQVAHLLQDMDAP